ETSDGFWTTITVMGPDCSTMYFSGAATLTWVPTAGAGLYKIGVAAREGRTAGLYSLTVTDAGPNLDEHPAETPVPLPADGTIGRGAIDYSFDVDAFVVTLAERTLYEIDLTDEGCGDVYASLRAPDGEAVGG